MAPSLDACRESLSPHVAPVALLILVNLLFSGYAVLGSAAFKSGTGPAVFALLRDLIACALFALALLRARPARPWPRAEHVGHFVLLAVTGVWGSQLMSALTIANLSAPIYGLLKPCVPVVTLALAAASGIAPFDLRTRATQLTVAGVTLAIGGGAAIVAASFADRESANALLGAGYVSLYMLCAGAYPILQKAMLRSFDYEPLVLVAWAYFIGTLMIFMSVIVVAPPASAWSVTPAGVGGLFFSGALSSFFNYFAMAWVNKRSSPVLVSAAYPLQSFFTPLLSSIVLGSELFASDFAGGAVVILGLGLCIRAQLMEGAAAQGGGGGGAVEGAALPGATSVAAAARAVGEGGSDGGGIAAAAAGDYLEAPLLEADGGGGAGAMPAR